MSDDRLDREKESAGRNFARRLGRWGVSLTTFSVNVGLAAAAVMIGVTTIQMRAEEKPEVAATPAVQVNIMRPVFQTGYEVRRSFVGRLEPARQTDLGFELSGTIRDIRIDEGGTVQKGEVIAVLDTRTLEAERRRQLANRRATESDRELAALTLDRQKKLKESGHVSEQVLDQARLTLSRLDATLVQIDATIESIDISLDKSVLKAPFDGIAGERLLDEGATVSSGLPVLKLLETAKPTVRIGLAPEVADQILRTETFEIEISGQIFPARLTAMRPDLQTRTRTIEALFQLEAPDNAPLFGRLAELSLPEHVEEEGFWVPTSALKEGPRGLWTVLAVVEAGEGERGAAFQVAREAVEVLHTSAGRSFVRGTITGETRIVADGVHRVVLGQLVSPAESGV
ncbi:MAG: efflux RND transporter periplasmic adaptor subunit [Roseibium sp.]|uniref:efflux RND transporter periplasmic adaptor subunit n=1 Tax=Roseibium sp. TaxID=1936156 RepID=UPI002622B8B0|nr:efflux RND transporter periplasmic adaptor subunit [Roseibium sp.]MCV0425305.1 efflux RND transporter periplasmic adaptor subunit [Roseibium sp.]